MESVLSIFSLLPNPLSILFLLSVLQADLYGLYCSASFRFQLGLSNWEHCRYQMEGNVLGNLFLSV